MITNHFFNKKFKNNLKKKSNNKHNMQMSKMKNGKIVKERETSD